MSEPTPPTPNAPTESELLHIRREKLAALRAKGIEPFGGRFDTTDEPGTLRANFQADLEVKVAGRVTARRVMGKAAFFDVSDITGRIQCYLSIKDCGEEVFHLVTHLVDIGDWLGVTGKTFITRTGEPSIHVMTVAVLSKSLRPLPEKWHGLTDREVKYRQRYLDLIANERSREVFLMRSRMVAAIRAHLQEKGFLEVETPMMQDVPGGAAAKPFETTFHALSQQMFLRIAPELYLKRLLVGGFTKIFELNRNFRNEGLSRRHNPEFTMLEAYWAFADFEMMADLVEELICHLAEKFCGGLEIKRSRVTELEHGPLFELHRMTARILGEGNQFQMKLRQWSTELNRDSMPVTAMNICNEIELAFSNHFHSMSDSDKSDLRRLREQIRDFTEERSINLSRPWRRADYNTLICEVMGDDWFGLTHPEMLDRAESMKVTGIYPELEDYEITQKVFEQFVESKSFDPLFVTHVPKELVPLAKQNAKNDAVVDVYELVINGVEISPGYSELNDPVVQRERLEHQAGEETQKIDEEFITALEYGMPPAGGIGIGIDRLVMMLTGAESIRDVILFPQLKRQK